LIVVSFKIMQKYRFKVIHLLGRHKYTREACHEMFELCYKHNIFCEPVQILKSTPVTYGMALDPFINIYKFDRDLNKKVIFNCLPSVGIREVDNINQFVSHCSNGVYENINIYVNLKCINDEYKKEIIKRSSNVYHDIYSMEDSKQEKIGFLRRHLGEIR
jgi:hypothetical protein